MNDNHSPHITKPEFDPHSEGKRGFLFGAVGTALVIGLLLGSPRRGRVFYCIRQPSVACLNYRVLL